ncbi:MAG: HAD hydrolase-like protein [Candidatus Obscuribacterales bacterium]|jgi:phosphoglycolate phosphatase-like HAD superfamily hydrolase|nr:HAD hydrolase-like protein [Candidatus Obscuribacterales bacterium]
MKRINSKNSNQPKNKRTSRKSGGKGQSSMRNAPAVSIVRAVGRHAIELVGTDFDLTTSDAFWAYYVPTIETEVPRIARLIGETDLDVVSREIGRVVNEAGTHEFPWFLEVSNIRQRFQGSAKEFREVIVQPFWATMERNKMRYSQAYPFVKETLMALRDAGIPVVFVSDGPMYQVLTRAKQTGLDELVSKIYALDTVEPTGLSDEDLEHGRKMVAQLMGTSVKCPFEVLPKHFEKPNPGGLQKAMSDFGIKDGSRVLFVGDSLKKDGGVAQAVGAGFVWATYGLYSLSPRARVLVDQKMNPVGSAPKMVNQKGGPFMPTVYPPRLADAGHFGEVLNHLGRPAIVSSGTILPPSASATAVVNTVGH